MLRWIAAAACAAVLAQPVVAQVSADASAVNFWCAGTLGNGHIFGFAAGRRLTTCNLEFTHRMFRLGPFTTRYAAAVMPIAWLAEPAQFNADSVALTGRTRNVFGAGASPVGIEISGPRVGRVEPVLASLGGFLYFSERVLSPRASRFNFTIDAAPGIIVHTGARTGIVAGFRYHHMSNANITNKNPGLDSEMIYAGVRLWSSGNPDQR